MESVSDVPDDSNSNSGEEMEEEEVPHSNMNSAKYKCLFCLSVIPKSVATTKYLEDVVPYDEDLRITLDNPTKNRQAFNVLCRRLNVNFMKDLEREGSINVEESLPLCLKCQNLYQEMYQLHIQVSELGRLLNERVKLIEKVILKSYERQRNKISWVEVFRAKVIHGNDNRRNAREEVHFENSDFLEDDNMGEDEGSNADNDDDTSYHHNESVSGDGGDDYVDEGADDGDDDGGGNDDDGTEEILPDSGSENEQDDDDVDYQVKPRRKYASPRRPPRYKSAYKNCNGVPRNLREYTCHICDEVIVGLNDFHKHYRAKHPDEKRYTCKFCKHYFRELHDCVTHQRIHTGEKPYECHYCQLSFRSMKLLKSHIKFRHERDQQEQFPCSECGRVFISQTILERHMDSHTDTVVVCKECGEALKSKWTFYNHNQRKHDGKAECTEPIDASNEEVKESIKGQHTSSFSCHVCWKKIYGKHNVKLHFQKEHPGVDPNQCYICQKVFNNYTDCRKHVRRHDSSGKPLQCDQCPRRFFTATELRIHSNSHVPEEQRIKYVCEICGAEFSSKHTQAQHLKRHTGEKAPMVCEICGKSYSERKTYMQHKKTMHSGPLDKPHQCPHCSKGFVLPSDLRRHLKSHTKERPLKCPYCPKDFPYESSHTRHIRDVHGIGRDGKPAPSSRKKGRKEESANDDRDVQQNIDTSNSVTMDSNFTENKYVPPLPNMF